MTLEITNDIDSYTSTEVHEALHANERTLKFRYEQLDRDGLHKRWMPTVLSGRVTYEEDRGVKRELDLEFVDDNKIIFASDRVRPWVYLLMPDGGHAGWAVGTFVFPFTRGTQTVGGNVIRSAMCPDMTEFLVRERITRRYELPTGTTYTDAVESLLRGAGITKMVIEHSSEALPHPEEWDRGELRLDVINELLSEINYRPIHFDAMGRAVVKKYVEPADRAPVHTYDFEDDSVTEMGVSVEDSRGATPNKWVMTASSPDRELVSVYINNDPTSPTSVQNLGYTVTADFRSVEASSQSVLDEKVRRRAIEDSQAMQTIEFTTAIMPFHDINDVVLVDFGEDLRAGKFEEVSWEFSLGAGETMIHRARRVFEA